jgi:hypothetical protein
VGIDLVEQFPRLLFDTLDGVGAGDPAQRRLGLVGEVDECGCQLGGIAPLLTVHAVPRLDSLPGALGVVVDRGLGVVRRLRGEQVGAEEPGLDHRRPDAERSDLRGQRLHPALQRELRRGVGGAERLPDQPGRGADRHDVTRPLRAQNR